MTVCEIPIDKLIPPWTCLRPVREDTVEFLEMVDSIRNNGILNSILVRPHPTRDGYWEIIDGMWRFTATKKTHIEEMPCVVKHDVEDNDILSLQIEANAVSYETRPIEFAHQMQKLLRLRESVGAPLTMLQLSGLVSKSTSWVTGRLNLLKLHDDLQEEIRAGRMSLGKGAALARINKHEHQLRIWNEHKDKKTRDFELEVGRFLQKVISDLDGRRAQAYQEPTLRPRLQSMDSMLIELDRLEEISQIIVSRGLTTAYEGAKLAIEWALNLHQAGRERQVSEKRFQLSDDERREIIGKQRYEELKQLRMLREERNVRQRISFEE